MMNKTVLGLLKNVGLVVAGGVAGGVCIKAGVKGIMSSFQKDDDIDEDEFDDDDDDEVLKGNVEDVK